MTAALRDGNVVPVSNTVTKPDDVLPYDRIQEAGDVALRRALLDAASGLLAAGGIGALSLRRVAAAVGCSTTVLYSQFGGKAGLVEALWLEGFARLWDAEQATPAGGDPLARVAALGWAYRGHALASPDFYRLMFGGVIPGFTPSATALAASHQTFGVLVDAVRDCSDAGIFRPEDPVRVATVLWATVHGVVSLQLSGNLADGEAIFERAMRAAGEGFLTEAYRVRLGGAQSSPE